jgi:hypothetical protein
MPCKRVRLLVEQALERQEAPQAAICQIPSFRGDALVDDEFCVNESAKVRSRTNLATKPHGSPPRRITMIIQLYSIEPTE